MKIEEFVKWYNDPSKAINNQSKGKVLKQQPKCDQVAFQNYFALQ